jgi:hypothetical protein
VRRRDWAAWLGVTTAIIAALGALVFNGVSATAGNRQIELSRQGQLTDRYSKAVEQLGSDSTDVRLGGIYALERLMRDSPSDQPTIVEVLAAFIRSNANKHPSPTPTTTPDVRAIYAQRPTDILAAIAVLGRRNTRHDPSKHPVDLSFANLAGLNLVGVNLTGMNLTGAYMRGTLLNQAKLTNATLGAVDLTDAKLRGADLTCAELLSADRREPRQYEPDPHDSERRRPIRHNGNSAPRTVQLHNPAALRHLNSTHAPRQVTSADGRRLDSPSGSGTCRPSMTPKRVHGSRSGTTGGRRRPTPAGPSPTAELTT